MKMKSVNENGVMIAVIQSYEVLIHDVQSALDLMMTAEYEMECKSLVINKEAVSEEFFKLSSGVAGEILQKFVNYKVKIAIYGDYSRYSSKPLKDFIYECNKGKDIFFTETLDEAVKILQDSFCFA